ncbi:hypothetical protein [Alteromonas flava]|uniref:hypothetical protein n=1 Tax=Alteromonas flava TaxID=2048003 RepID=UPI000C287A84|nr:hypothetical protein [Alteromonas flava]
MKNFVSFNIKAKKKSDADPMILHLENQNARKKSDNILFPENSHLNVSSQGILKKYQEVTKKIESIKGKKIQKNANHYLEGVLAFSFEKYIEDPENFRNKAPKLIEKYMNEIAQKYHFEPLGYSLHFDEGSTCEKTGEKKLNVHAHLSFINFDFKTNKARFREIQQKFNSKRKYPNEHFMKMQDLAGDCFRSIGFTRGVEKQKSKKKHLEKIEFVEKKLQEKEEKIQDLEIKIKSINKRGREKQQKIRDLEVEKELLEEYSESLKEEVKEAENRLKKIKLLTNSIFKKALIIAKKYLSNFYTHNKQEYKRDIDNYSQVVVDYEQFDKIEAERAQEEINKELFNNDKDLINDVKKSKSEIKLKFNKI